MRRHALLEPVAAKLSAHDVARAKRRNRLENLDSLIPERFAVSPDRRLHGQATQHLEQMILDHVADGARLVIERAPALDPKIFGHGDLYALDMVSIPEGFEERIREPKKEHVVHWPLAQVMVDA